MDKPGKGIGLLIGIGKAEPEEMSAKDEACRALWDAIREKDYEAFKESLALYLDERDDEVLESESEDSEDEDY